MKDIYEKMDLFYLGKDEQDSLTLYKSKHLTTHAMLIGMTGSGKTGLGITLLEEAALDNIPSIVIDPKGDMGNLCLAFENLSAQEFEAWVEEKSLAEDKAILWREGLEKFHQDASRVKRFAEIEKTIYTPGSSAGVGVNILGSFEAPSKEVLEDSDTLNSLINTTVSSLLALLSINADPISSKEHLLLSNILHHFYTQEISLTLEDIIGYIASPPFEKIGLFQLQTFYPQNERMKLSMALNGVISSISFSSWLQGEALNISKMLYDENGKAKIAIFSIAHLSENERMFFVTILLNAYINWMRKQKGSDTLRNILYMDEIFGFFPPLANPPSKKPMLLLLKQARAFGTGVILSTQNPVDIDYKGLANIGTWFVGKLQTSQDIQKVLEPLAVKSSLSKEQITHTLATLKGRHFFMKNVHSDATVLFSTRWALSYLKGPMALDDIKVLMKKKKSSALETKEVTKEKATNSLERKQIISQSIKEYFLDTHPNSTLPFYPYLYARLDIRFYNQKRSIDFINHLQLQLELDTSQTFLEWKNSLEAHLNNFSIQMPSNAEFAPLPSFIIGSKSLKEFEKSLSDFIYNTQNIQLYTSKELKLESLLGQSKQEFMVTISNELKELKNKEQEKLEERFEKQLNTLEDKLKHLELKLQKEKHDVSAKTTDTLLDIGLTLIGAFFGRKALSATNIKKGVSAISKGKGIFKESNDVQNVELLMQELRDDIEELQLQLSQEIDDIDAQFHIENYEITTLNITPRRSDIVIKEIALLWKK